MNRTLTAVRGIRVGHASVEGAATGCTVILGPFRAAVQVLGIATGTRELDTLAPEHVVPRVDAILLTGGSAYGLSAADGVMEWLAERGRGYATPVTPVPIVPAAVIYDLAEGARRPGPELGRAACDDASEAPVVTGRVGCGAGATVGKLAGPNSGAPGGLGSWAVEVAEWTVSALAVVNAVGNVVGRDGGMVAGGPPPGGDVGMTFGGEGGVPGTNTTLCVVATDAPLERIDLLRMARMAGTALARRIDPVHTPFDGDVLFAVSPSPDPEPVSAPTLTRLGLGARRALEEAITGAVAPGEPS